MNYYQFVAWAFFMTALAFAALYHYRAWINEKKQSDMMDIEYWDLIIESVKKRI
jgi:hypothetical protein